MPLFVMRNLAEIEELELFSQLDLIAKLVVEGFLTGLHRSPYHGFSVEFAEHRHYNTGESTKHIDWKLYGRSEKLFVKKYEEETNLKAHLILDISSSMLFPYPWGKLHNKLFFSIYSAAALIRLLTSQRDAAGLYFFSDKINLQTDSKVTQVHRQHLFSELSNLMDHISESKGKDILNQTTRSAEILHQIADALPARSLVILFSDMMDQQDPDDLISALQHFRYNQHELIVFQVTDDVLENEFSFSNKPHRFIDMETGEVLRLNPAAIRDQYVKSMEEHRQKIKLKCGQLNIDLIQANVRSDFKDVLLPFLIRRKKLF